MKTVLFAHDGYIILSGDEIYSSTYNNKIVEEYLKIAEKVVLLVRIKKCVNIDIKNLNKITVKNLDVIGIENFKSLKGLISYHNLLRKVKHEVQKADYVVSKIPSDLGFLAAKYAHKYKKKYLVEVVGCPWDSLRNHSILGKIIAPYYYLKQKGIVKSAPYVIYVTQKFLQERYPSDGVILSCSDVIIKNGAHVLEKRLEKIKKTNTNEIVFASIGAINMKYKGYDLVIKALSQLNKAGTSYKYIIAGSGDPSWLNNIIYKNNANNFVKVLSNMPHEKVFNWLDDIDIYIQPSRTEGLPRALIEAMSRACPCIGSNVGGIPELISTDFIFKKNDFNNLKLIIKKITKEKMLSEAKRNYEISLNYRLDKLEIKRNRFISIFKKNKRLTFVPQYYY